MIQYNELVHTSLMDVSTSISAAGISLWVRCIDKSGQSWYLAEAREHGRFVARAKAGDCMAAIFKLIKKL